MTQTMINAGESRGTLSAITTATTRFAYPQRRARSLSALTKIPCDENSAVQFIDSIRDRAQPDIFAGKYTCLCARHLRRDLCTNLRALLRDATRDRCMDVRARPHRR